MSSQHVLHFARMNIEPAADDHVLLSIENEHVAALVGARDIVGVKPAIAQRLGGLFGALPVFGHRIRRTHTDLAGLAHGDPFSVRSGA